MFVHAVDGLASQGLVVAAEKVCVLCVTPLAAQRVSCRSASRMLLVHDHLASEPVCAQQTPLECLLL
jgi:hypothetical protein